MTNLSQNIIEFYDKLASWEHEVIRGSNITLQQMHTVEVIGFNNNIRMKDLAEKLGVVMGTLTVMIQRLVKLELVKRSKDKDDKRSYIITLTGKGYELFEEHQEKHELLVEEITVGLTEFEQMEFNKSLDKILKSF